MEIKKVLLLKSLFEQKEIPTLIEKNDNDSYQIKLTNKQKTFEAKTLHWEDSSQILFFKINHKPYKAQIALNKKTNELHIHLINLLDNLDSKNFIISINPKPSVKKNKSLPRKFKETLKSPLTGKIIKCYVKPNQEVHKDQPLFIIESMKIENEIKADTNAFVKTIPIKEGDLVKTNEALIIFKKE